MPRNSGEIDAHTVTIHDARSHRGLWLDGSGFELLAHRATLREFREFQDPAAVRAIDYAEVESHLNIVTGAQKVVIFDHTLRDSTVVLGQPALREPVRRVMMTRPSLPPQTESRNICTPMKPPGACSAASPSSMFGGLSALRF